MTMTRNELLARLQVMHEELRREPVSPVDVVDIVTIEAAIDWVKRSRLPSGDGLPNHLH